jgi:predicted amidohydrolase YtcJ
MSQTLIFAGGTVFTGVRAQPWAEAAAIRGSEIVGVGSRAELRERCPGADEVDLQDGTLLPGFVDAHNHFLSTGESLGSLDLRFPGVDTAESLLRVVRASAAATPDGETVTGFGFDNSRYELPILAELDAAAGDHPLQLFHTSGHNVLVNSIVLAERGIGHDVLDPPGGHFVRTSDGRLTGYCLDAACGLVVPTEIDIGSHGPNFHTEAPMDTLVGAVARASSAFLAAGLTCVADAQVTSRELRAYRAARERGVVSPRTVCMPLSHQLEEFNAIGLAGPFGDERLLLGHLKIYADGSLTGGSAAFSPELGVRDQSGSLFHAPDELRDLIVRASAGGWRVGVHAQGDLAISLALDGFERAQAQYPRPDARPRIEHAGLPLARGVARMAQLGVIAINQPSYLHDFGDAYAESLGEHVEDLQPWRDELDAGVRVVISSDSDVASFQPLTTVANAMLRRTSDGRTIGARHRLTLEEALFAHTIDAAFAVGLENRIGSLEPGKAADLVWLASDLRRLDPAQVAHVPILATYLDGQRLVTG